MVKYWQIALKPPIFQKIPCQISGHTVCPTQVELPNVSTYSTLQCNACVVTYSIFTSVCVLLLVVRHIHMLSVAPGHGPHC